MNTPTHGSAHDPATDADFDARLRAVHAGAVAATPARVRLQLHPRRAPAARARHYGWSLAAAGALALVAAGLLWQRPVTTAPDSSGQVAATSPATLPAAESIDFDEAYAALDESPGMYLWLASSDASAMLDSNLPDATDGAGNGVTR